MPGMPAANRRLINREQITQKNRTASHIRATKRLAVIQLEDAANQLEGLSAALDEKEDGTIRAIAERIDRVTNTLEQE
jgi:hypothetical protein